MGKETTGLAREYIDAFYDDMDRIGVLRADKEPRATEHIEGMIHMIKVLLEQGYAYVEGTDVFFSVKDFREYGKLSGRKLDDMQAGSSRDSVLALQSGLVRIYRTLRRVGDLVGPPGEDFTGTRESMPGHTPGWARPPEDGSLKSPPAGRPTSPPGPDGGTPGEEGPGHDQFLEQFIKTMDDDLNTAGAMGLVFDKVREMNKLMDSGDAADDEATRRHLAAGRHELLLAGRVLGLLQEVPGEFFRQLSGTKASIDPAEIERMIRERAAAKAEKDWSKADEIRERLKGMGIVLEDTPGGTTWRLDV